MGRDDGSIMNDELSRSVVLTYLASKGVSKDLVNCGCLYHLSMRASIAATVFLCELSGGGCRNTLGLVQR